MILLDLVVPFYNPQPGWELKFVSRFQQLVRDYFQGDPDSIHVVVVNDGSTVRFTEKETGYLQQHIPRLKTVCYSENRGKGFALRTGVAEAVSDYCIYSDNDFPFGLEAIRQIYDALRQGADIVTGHRTNGNYFRHLPFKRKVISKGLTLVNKYLLRLPVSDTQAGIKGFNRLGRKLFLDTTTDRFLFDMEFILLAGKVKGIRIKELPVNIRAGVKMSDFSSGIMKQEFKNLLRIIFKKKQGRQNREELM